MKTLNKQIHKIGKWTFGVAMISMMLVAVGCGESDGGGTTARVTNPGGGCQGGFCPNGESDLLVSALGEERLNGGQIHSQMSLNIYGQNVHQSSSSSFYQGAISVSGSYRVEVADFIGCPVYRGRYDVITLEPLGTMNSVGIFGNLKLRLEGREGEAAGHVLFMEIASAAYNGFTQPRLSFEGIEYRFGVWANTRITGVDTNGNCSQNLGTFFSY